MFENNSTTSWLEAKDFPFRVARTESELLQLFHILTSRATKIEDGIKMNIFTPRQFAWLWVAEVDREAIRKLDRFFDRGRGAIWEATTRIGWLTNNNYKAVSQGKVKLEQSLIVRLQLKITRADGKLADVAVWLDGNNQLNLLHNIYDTKSVWLMTEKLHIDRYITSIPPFEIDDAARRKLYDILERYS